MDGLQMLDTLDFFITRAELAKVELAKREEKENEEITI